MDNQLNYYRIAREEWRTFYQDHIVKLTEEELVNLKALNDQISMQDVQDVYMPLIHLLRLRLDTHQAEQDKQAEFLGIQAQKVPFILGIAGSVAVGKSTTARLLKTLLSEVFPDKKVQLITTDGFLYPNEILQQKNIMNRKGFPESYDMKTLLNFINDVKNNLPAKAPVYSHKVYDIIAGKFEKIKQPDILIVEGINVLQLPSNQQIYMSDFFDFSIYVDAKEKLIEKWYLERFETLLDHSMHDPDNYFHKYALGSRKDALVMAKNTWKTINLKNLREFILPTRSRADLILHKTNNHRIDELLLRKY